MMSPRRGIVLLIIAVLVSLVTAGSEGIIDDIKDWFEDAFRDVKDPFDSDEDMADFLGWDYHVSIDRYGEKYCTGDMIGKSTMLEADKCHSWDEDQPFESYRHFVGSKLIQNRSQLADEIMCSSDSILVPRPTTRSTEIVSSRPGQGLTARAGIWVVSWRLAVLSLAF